MPDTAPFSVPDTEHLCVNLTVSFNIIDHHCEAFPAPASRRLAIATSVWYRADGISCTCCGSAVATERPEATARGYPRFRCRDCGRHRTSAYLNNRLEQDNRGIKGGSDVCAASRATMRHDRFCREHGELRNLLRAGIIKYTTRKLTEPVAAVPTLVAALIATIFR
jgi:hypothetical protein